MRITGKRIWGAPADPEEAKATLRRLPELNVNLLIRLKVTALMSAKN